MFKLFTPYHFNKFSKFLTPILASATIFFVSIGLYFALIASPADYQQGELVRMMYIHVPASWMALGVYTFMAICSFSNLVWKTVMPYLFAISASKIGCVFALISLVTGSLWGKPIWGTWWVWDARLTSMLILFLLYLSYIILIQSSDNIRKVEKPAAVLALIGFINVPIIKYSVNMWYSLHQPASVIRFGAPTIHYSMLVPLIIMLLGFLLYFLLILTLQTSLLIENLKIIRKKDDYNDTCCN